MFVTIPEDPPSRPFLGTGTTPETPAGVGEMSSVYVRRRPTPRRRPGTGLHVSRHRVPCRTGPPQVQSPPLSEDSGSGPGPSHSVPVHRSSGMSFVGPTRGTRVLIGETPVKIRCVRVFVPTSSGRPSTSERGIWIPRTRVG